MKYFSVLFLIISLFSCKENLDDYLMLRSWIITEMTYNKTDLKPFLLMNSLEFEPRNICHIPVYDDGGFIYKSDGEAKWSITEDNLLNIQSKKEYMNGEFEICFGKDLEKKSVYMIIKSKDLYLKAYRGNFGDGFTESLPISCDEGI